MMKAEIAREIIRSRSQTPSPVPVRTGSSGPEGQGSEAEPEAGKFASIAGGDFGSEELSGMLHYCIQKRHQKSRL